MTIMSLKIDELEEKVEDLEETLRVRAGALGEAIGNKVKAEDHERIARHELCDEITKSTNLVVELAAAQKTIRKIVVTATGSSPMGRCPNCKAIHGIIIDAANEKCEHGRGLTDYCQPCGRINGGGG